MDVVNDQAHVDRRQLAHRRDHVIASPADRRNAAGAQCLAAGGHELHGVLVIWLT